MKNYIIFGLFILISIQSFAQKSNYNAELGYSIFKEMGMEYYGDNVYRIDFDWDKVREAKFEVMNFCSEHFVPAIENTFGNRVEFIFSNDFVLKGHSISIEKIGNVYLNESKTIKIKDVAWYIGLYKRESLATYNVEGHGVYIVSRTEKNEPITYVYTADHKLKVIEMHGYGVLGYSPNTKTFILGKMVEESDDLVKVNLVYDIQTGKVK